MAKEVVSCYDQFVTISSNQHFSQIKPVLCSFMTLKMKICLIRSTPVQAAVEQSSDNTALPRLWKDKEMSKVKKPWMIFWNCLQSLMNVDWHMWFRDLTKILFTSIYRRHRADKIPTIFRLIWLRIVRKKRKRLESIYHQELSKLFVLIRIWKMTEKMGRIWDSSGRTVDPKTIRCQSGAVSTRRRSTACNSRFRALYIPLMNILPISVAPCSRCL